MAYTFLLDLHLTNEKSNADEAHLLHIQISSGKTACKEGLLSPECCRPWLTWGEQWIQNIYFNFSVHKVAVQKMSWMSPLRTSSQAEVADSRKNSNQE